MSLKKAWQALWGRETVEIKQKDPRANYEMTEEDRQHSVEMRRLRQETARMQQRMELMRQKAELRELKAELFDEEEDGEDNDGDISSMLLQLLNTVKGGQMPPAASEIGRQPSPQTYQTALSDQDIRDFIIKNVDRPTIEKSKKMPKELVKRQIIQMSGVTEQEAERAHHILLTEF